VQPLSGPAGGRAARRRRDRHGRGLRGALAPSTVPIGRTRAERFDDHVVDAFEQVAADWGSELAGVQVVVEDVPPETPDAVSDAVPMGRVDPATRRQAARIVVYRRPIEARTREAGTRAEVVHEVVVSLVADLLGIEPGQVDPEAGAD
jgi:predicted Zn-dependent protease with MMP-like domain